MPSSSSVSGKVEWFIVLMEDQQPVNIIPWASWVRIVPDERPPNSNVVSATDELDAFIKVKRGELFDL
jgi:hypothetical protein